MTDIQEKVIKSLAVGLSNLEPVYGLVLIGSSATSVGDEYSDLDFWVTVRDGQEKFVTGQIESILAGLGELDINFDEDQSGSSRRQVFHLRGTPGWHKIDIAIAPLSGAYVYTRGLDAPVKVLINKNDTVKFKELDRAELNAKMQEQLVYQKNLFAVHKAEIEKYCLRNKFLEAYQYYEAFALQPLVAAERAVYASAKQGFYLKHIYADLPERTTKQLESLYKVKSASDISSNLSKIEKLFEELVIPS